MNTPATRARTAAMHMEVKKDGLAQRQDGRWQLKVIIHPNDMPAALSLAAMGTRYMCAMVELDDDEQPVERPAPEKPHSYAQRAGILCQEPGFRKFLCERQQFVGIAVLDLDMAADELRQICGVTTRKDLIEGTPAGDKFRDLAAEYDAWRRVG